MEADERHRVHERYEEKWAGEKDADEYKNLTAEKRRESFAFQNAEGKRQRNVLTESRKIIFGSPPQKIFKFLCALEKIKFL